VQKHVSALNVAVGTGRKATGLKTTNEFIKIILMFYYHYFIKEY